jgi:hypothetical protein
MIAHALLVMFVRHERALRPSRVRRMIKLTCSEIRRLFTILVIEPHFTRDWSGARA